MEKELILELREFLQEHIYTAFFTHYALHYRDQLISDYADLTCLDEIDQALGGTEEPRRIYMKPLLYSESAARNHVKRCSELLTKPCLLNAMQNVSKEEEDLL